MKDVILIWEVPGSKLGSVNSIRIVFFCRFISSKSFPIHH